MKKSSFFRRAQEMYARARRTADRVLDETFVAPAQRVWSVETSKLVHGVARAMRAVADMSPAAVAYAQHVLRMGMHRAALNISTHLAGTTGAVLSEGLKSAAEAVRFVRQSPTPLEDLVLRAQVTHMREKELARLRADSARGTAVEINRALASNLHVMAMKGASVREMIDAVGDTADRQAWRIERLVRTETSFAYNAAHDAALEELAVLPEYRGLHKRWTEHVVDGSRKPMDNRVGRDSIQMHGQVAKPGGAFSAPADWRVPGSWVHPPNRPNDRCVLTPWMREWGVPAWMWQAGRRIEL